MDYRMVITLPGSDSGIVMTLNLFSNNSTIYRHSDPHVIVRDINGPFVAALHVKD
jgi:hypothetical protein